MRHTLRMSDNERGIECNQVDVYIVTPCISPSMFTAVFTEFVKCRRNALAQKLNHLCQSCVWLLINAGLLLHDVSKIVLTATWCVDSGTRFSLGPPLAAADPQALFSHRPPETSVLKTVLRAHTPREMVGRTLHTCFF